MADTSDYLEVKNITHYGALNTHYGVLKHRSRTLSLEYLEYFSARFAFGRSYLLNGYPTDGGWAVSWILAGKQSPISGTVRFNGTPITTNRLKQLSWSVGYDKIKVWGRPEQSVGQQIEYGIRAGLSIPQWTKADFAREFWLNDSVLTRRLSRISGDQLHTGCAVGLANGKRVYCFPYIKTWHSNLLDDYINMGFRHIVHTLTSFGCLVIIPMLVQPRFHSLCDEIINVYTPLQDREP